MSGSLKTALLVLCFVFFAPILSHAGWQKTTISTGDEFQGACQSIAVDPQGHPHIVYIDDSTPLGRRVTHAFFDGSTWHRERVDNGDEEVVLSCSLAVDALGGLHVGYSAWQGNRWDLMYAHFDGTQWNVSQLGEGGNSVSIAVDGAGQPHLAHIKPVPYPDWPVEYVRLEGTQWIKETVALHGNLYYGTSIALTPSGKVHISYSDYGPPSKVFWATNTSGAWHATYVGDGVQSSLALDSSENPHIAYYSEQTGELKYAHLSTSGWVVETIDPHGETPAIAVDSHDHPHIAYASRPPAGVPDVQAKYAYFDGTTWNNQLIDNTFSGWNSSLALDQLGLPHVSYARVVNIATRSVVYAYLPMPDLTGEWTSITVTQKKGKQNLTGLLHVSNVATGKSAKGNVAFYLSDDDIYGGDVPIGKVAKVSALNPGQSKTVKFKYTSANSLSGKYLIAVIDSGNAASEADEGNNVVIGQIP